MTKNASTTNDAPALANPVAPAKPAATGNSVVANQQRRLTRRAALGAAACAGVAATGMVRSAQAKESAAPDESYRAHRKRVKQSVMAWCLKPMKMEDLIPACAKMGMVAMEGINSKYYPLMKKHGLAVSLVSSHGFAKGPLSRDNYDYCRERLKKSIDLATEWNCRNVITFTGMRAKGINDQQAEANCVEFWKSIIGYAEEKGVTLVLEHLNSRDDSHPMKGHPGYFGDDVDHCVEMIRKVDSPNMKLLFDIYHVQIMNGDVIRRIRQHKEVIAHIHTAGVPGRGELDETQELNYPAVIRALDEIGYKGHVVQEFIPTWKDPLAALRHGVSVCDID